MIIYPKGYFNKITDITYEYLEFNNINGLILDVDNTLIDYYENLSEETIEWVNLLKDKGIKMCILSNSNKLDKVKRVAEKLDIEYIHFGMKPFKRGFTRAVDILKIEEKNIAVIGDQIFTDVLGANRMKMYSILVDPIKEKDIFITVLKRPVENYIKKMYIRKKDK